MMNDMEILGLLYNSVIACGFTGIGTCAYRILKPNIWKDLFMSNNIVSKYQKKVRIPKLVKKQITRYGYLLKFKAPIGVSSSDFIKNQTAINEMLNARTGIYFDKGYVYVKVYTGNLEKEYPFEKVETGNDIKILIGMTINGIKTVELNNNKPHLYIAGMTGSGKSTLLRGIIVNLILNDSDNIDLHLLDLKGGVELGWFEKCKMVKSFTDDVDTAYIFLEELLNEVQERFKHLREYDCVNIDNYNKMNKKNKLKKKLVIIDEFAELSDDKKIMRVISRVSSLGRACGIHLILATQRPDKDVLDGKIKSNFNIAVGLKAKDSINSRIIIDEAGLETLRGSGHGLLKSGDDMWEFQALNITDEEAKKLIEPYKIKKDNKKDPRKSLMTKATNIEHSDVFGGFWGKPMDDFEVEK